MLHASHVFEPISTLTDLLQGSESTAGERLVALKAAKDHCKGLRRNNYVQKLTEKNFKDVENPSFCLVQVVQEFLWVAEWDPNPIPLLGL